MIVKNDKGFRNVVLQYNIPEQMVLLYDQPMEREGKWGKYYIYNVLASDGEPATWLISEKTKGEEFKPLKANLDKFKAGDKIEVVKTEEYTKSGRQFALFKVTKVGEEDVSVHQKKTSSSSTQQQVNMSEEEKYVLDKLKNEVANYDKEKLMTYRRQFIDQLISNGLTEIRANFLFDKYILDEKQ